MGGVRARVGFFGGTTDLGLAQRIWAKTDKARVRRRARRRPFSLGLKWADGYGRCVRACGFLGGQNGLLRGEKIWHNGSGQKRTKRACGAGRGGVCLAWG